MLRLSAAFSAWRRSRRRPTLRLCQTEDLIVNLIRAGVLGLDEADSLLVEWAAKHRFKSRLTTFRDRL